MEYTHLGRSGLSVSRLCLGTMNFGPLTPPSRRARDHGPGARARHQLLRHRQPLRQRRGGRAGRGPSRARGWTEEIIGDWFAQGGGRRERTVLATKLYGEMGDWPNEGKLSALNIRRACDASPQAPADRLHRPLPDAPHRPGHAVGRDLAGDGGAVTQGKILYVGSSQLRRLAHRPGQRPPPPADFVGLVSEQSLYNLITRDVELEVFPAAKDYGVGVIPWSPLGGGLLGGVLSKEREGRRRLAGRAAGGRRGQARPDRGLRGLLRRARAKSPATSRSPGCCTRTAVTAPIIGPRKPQQLDDAMRALTSSSTTDALAPTGRDLPRLQDRARALRLVSTTPGEHYAW